MTEVTQTIQKKNMDLMIGKFKRVSEEGYDAFLTKLEVGMLFRNAATASTPTLEISESGGKWKIVTSTTLSHQVHFEIGVAFDETTSYGRECRTTVTIDGNKLITVQVPVEADKPAVKVIREFLQDGCTMHAHYTCQDVTSKQVYKRI